MSLARSIISSASLYHFISVLCFSLSSLALAASGGTVAPKPPTIGYVMSCTEVALEVGRRSQCIVPPHQRVVLLDALLLVRFCFLRFSVFVSLEL